MMNNIKDEFDEIDELINEPTTNDNDKQLLKDALAEVRELKKMYQQEIARYKEVTRQLQVGLSELKTLKEEFAELQDLMYEDEDEDEADEDIEE